MARHRSIFLFSLLAAALLSSLPAAAQAPVILVPGGQPTLTAAISAVPDGGIIQLAAGTYTSPAGGFAISNPNKRFTIRAASGALVVLSGNNTQPVLQYQVNSAPLRGHVIFEDLVFRNGRSAANGVAGGVTLNGGAQATFRRCTFETSTSQAAATGGGGAGAFNSSKAFFIDCLFQNNTAKNEGAGLRVGEGSEVYVHGSRFLNNSCALPGHRNSAAGGGIHVTNSRIWVTNSRFEGNRAGYTGGGFYILGSWQDPVTTPRAEATIANCTFVGNTADNDPGVVTVGPTEGGAFHSEDQSTVAIYNSRFIKNDADLGGGVSQYRSINTIKGSVFLGNRSLAANGFGGAIKSNSEDTTLDGAINRRSVQLVVSESLFVGRHDGVTTVGEKGGGVFVNGDGNRAWGGGGVSQQGTVASNRANATLQDCAFVDLDTTRSGGGAVGGGIEMSHTTFGMTGSIVAGCDALGTNSSGGGGRVVIASSANIVGNTFVGNSATLFGGGLYSQGAALTANGNQLFRNEISPGVNEGVGSSFGAALFTAQLDAAPFNTNQTGAVNDNLFTDNIGLPVFDDDRNGPVINDQRYDANRFFNTTFGAQIYTDSLVGPKTVAELNSLVVTRGAAGPTDKSPASNNTALGSQPNAGELIAVPKILLAEGAAGDADSPEAYLVYGWSGPSGATLDGVSVTAGGNWGRVAGTPAVHTLNVGGTTFLARIDAAPIPDATLSFSPPAISAGGSAVLSWSADEGSFLFSAIDQQVSTGGAASGSTTVSPNVTRPYTLLVITEEGGAVVEQSLFVDEVPDVIFDDGFESGNTAEWDLTLP